MHESGLLVLTKHVSSLCRGDNISRIVSSVKKIVATKLYVHLDNVSIGSPTSYSLENKLNCQQPASADVLSFLMKFYSEAATQCDTLNVNVLLHNLSTGHKNSEILHRLNTPVNCIISDFSHDFTKSSSDSHSLMKLVQSSYQWNKVSGETVPLIGISQSNLLKEETTINDSPLLSKGSVVLGGTFDHIHVGHKILLSEAMLMADKRLLIGVTAKSMVGRKTLSELIKPWHVRATQLREFVDDVSGISSTLPPDIQENEVTRTERSKMPKLEIVEINDPIGPAGSDPNLNCIVVSQETLKGGAMVNDARIKNGLEPVSVHVIGGGVLLQASEGAGKTVNEAKVSSSILRYESLGSIRKAPGKPQAEQTPENAYIIGLTGGICCGKTSIAAQLEKLGAFVVNCDRLGHQAYLPGTDTFAKVVAHFGTDIVAPDGTIDRPSLGAKVFGAKGQLEALNAIVWPEIKRLAMAKISDALKDSTTLRVCVLDAAVLLEAGWEDMTHEVWVSIVPPEEAVERIVSRDGRSREDGRRRIDAQLSNQQRVDRAHVVFSTLWHRDQTQKQIEKAWKELQVRTNKKDDVGTSLL